MTRLYDTTARMIRTLSGRVTGSPAPQAVLRSGPSPVTGSDTFTDLLKTLVRTPSVTGAEYAFYRALCRELEERGAKVALYEGLLVATGTRPDSLMISAHIDRHGLICTGPNEFQYAAYVASNRSDLLGNSVSEQMMHLVADRFAGMPVFAYEPWTGAYLGHGSVEDAHICPHRHNLNFTVKGLEHVSAGVPVAFRDSLRIADGHYSAQLDNVLSAAMLVHLFERGFQGTAFFTAQEEAGKSWRYLLEWFRRFGGSTNHLLVLDTSPYRTRDEADAQDIVLRTRDANAPFNAARTARVEEAAQALGARVTYKDRFIDEENAKAVAFGDKPRSLGSTELGRIVAATHGMVDGTTVQIPTTGYHTTSETASIAACDAVMALLLKLAEVRPPA
jgi:putative aminopeptidase FrvX